MADKRKETVLKSIGEVAHATGYSVEHLRELDKRGVVTAGRVAGQRVYDIRDIDKLLARKEQTAKRAR